MRYWVRFAEIFIVRASKNIAIIRIYHFFQRSQSSGY
jgi:hypothetical protein